MLLAEYFAVLMAKELGREYFQGFTEEADSVTPGPPLARQRARAEERGGTRRVPLRPGRGCARDHDRSVRVAVPAQDAPVAAPIADTSTAPPTPEPADAKPTFALPLDLKQTVQDLEIDLVNEAMEAAKFNQRRAAELLGLTYHQFRGYLKKYALQNPEPDAKEDAQSAADIQADAAD